MLHAKCGQHRSILHGKAVDDVIQNVVDELGDDGFMLRSKMVRHLEGEGVLHDTAEYHVTTGIKKHRIPILPGNRVISWYTDEQRKIRTLMTGLMKDRLSDLPQFWKDARIETYVQLAAGAMGRLTDKTFEADYFHVVTRMFIAWVRSLDLRQVTGETDPHLQVPLLFARLGWKITVPGYVGRDKITA